MELFQRQERIYLVERQDLIVFGQDIKFSKKNEMNSIDLYKKAEKCNDMTQV